MTLLVRENDEWKRFVLTDPFITLEAKDTIVLFTASSFQHVVLYCN